MRTHSLPTNHKCNICDRVFPEAAVLAEHKLTHCKVKRGDVCVVCKLVMTSEDQFYSHSQEHGLQGSAMTCIVCRQTLSSLLELQLHGRTHFSPTSVEYTCIVCLARFDTSEHLLSKVNAAGREYFVCRPCFSGGDKRLPYACSDCPLRFASQREVVRVQWFSQIETQGYSGEWVKSYTLSYSINQKDFLFILDYDGSRKIFKGNDDDTTLVRHEFGPYVARYIRLHPIDFHERATLQWKISYTGMK